MDEKFIVQIVIPLLSGGAAGAIITTLVQSIRSRVPQVTYTVEQDRVFTATGADNSLQANVSVEHDKQAFHFSNLSLVKVTLANSSSRDHAAFDLGLTLPTGHGIIKVECISKDRLHVVACQPTPSPSSPGQFLDVLLTPFNRGDSVVIKLYIHSSATQFKADDLQVATSASVNLIRVGSLEESQRRKLQVAAWSRGASTIVNAVVLPILLASIVWTYMQARRLEGTIHTTEMQLLRSEIITLKNERVVLEAKQLLEAKKQLSQKSSGGEKAKAP
jgi:hypothetical protein